MRVILGKPPRTPLSAQGA